MGLALGADLLDLIARTAEEFITQPSSELDAGIDHTLARIGTLFDVDRAYVFTVGGDGLSVSNSHEWCASGVSPQRENLQDLPCHIMPWWMEQLRAGRAINLYSLEEMPADAAAERELLSAQGIQSLLVLPLVRRGNLDGFVGFDHVRAPRHWRREEVEVLSIVVSSFAQGFERRQIDARLERMAFQDPLTDLPNRTLLSHRLKEALEGCRKRDSKLAVGYLDLDAFKPINDLYGHAMGDELLVEMGRRLSACVRPGDTVGRLGGDEFVVILPDLRNSAELESMGCALLNTIAQPCRLSTGIEVSVSTSLGLRLVPPDDADPDTLLRQADQAMYAAKRAGHGRMQCFDVEMERRENEHLAQVRTINDAIVAGQMVLHVQPILDLTTEQVSFLEVLVRWSHPERGVLLPGEWLPLIENTATVETLGEWVMEQALHHAVPWVREGLCQGISINVSPRELLDPAFPRLMAERLSRHPDLPAQAIRLEVLETASLKDLDHVDRTLQACREMGLTFALDDFGTGYSSLTYLRRLPVSVLKIDRSFVSQMQRQAGDAAIVRGVIDIARALGLLCVAEGVETPQHLEILSEMGCDLAQGFGIARPMPADAFPAWARRRHSNSPS